MNVASPLLPDLSHRDRLSPKSRYELLARIAAGGMGTVYLGRLRGPAGFRRLVALKRAHEHLVRDPSFARMFRTEARLASLLHHPNVVAVHDVEELDGELVLVMDYVQGANLSSLLASGAHDPLDPSIALRVLLDAAAGLQAAHELTNDEGRPLGVVHRDVSPDNVLVGIDGVARISDFGVAKCVRATMGATDGQDLKGKLAYMAPECVHRDRFDARSDVFALGVVAWESFCAERLFRATNEVATIKRVLGMTPRRPSEVRPGLPPALDSVILRALEKLPEARWPSARAFADALEDAARASGLVPAPYAMVGEQVRDRVGDKLDARHRALSLSDAPDANEHADPPPHEISEIRVTESIPRPVFAAARASDPMAQTTEGVVVSAEGAAITTEDAIEGASEGAASKPRARSRRTVALIAAACAVLGVLVVSTSGKLHAAGPTAATSGRPLEAVLIDRPPVEVSLATVDPPPPAPEPRAAATKSPSVRAERLRGRASRGPTSRDMAAPNPYGPGPR